MINISCMTMFYLLTGLVACFLYVDLVGASDSTTYPRVELSVNSTWSELCGIKDNFKISLRNMFVNRSSTVIAEYRFHYPFLTTNCTDLSLKNQMASPLIIYILQPSPRNNTISQNDTEQLSKLVSKGDIISGKEILEVRYIKEIEDIRYIKEIKDSRQIFSTNIIISMIVIICVVYLIGFGLIVLTQSEGDSSKGAAEVAYVISSRNQGYIKQSQTVTTSTKRR